MVLFIVICYGVGGYEATVRAAARAAPVIVYKPVIFASKPVSLSGKPAIVSRKPVSVSKKPISVSKKPVGVSRKPVRGGGLRGDGGECGRQFETARETGGGGLRGDGLEGCGSQRLELRLLPRALLLLLAWLT